MGRLHAGKAAGATAGLPLLTQGQVIKLPASVGSVGHLLVLPKDANSPADGNGCALVVPSNHDHSDPSITAQLDRACDLLSGRVQHAYHADECQVHLGRQQRVTGSATVSETAREEALEELGRKVSELGGELTLDLVFKPQQGLVRSGAGNVPCLHMYLQLGSAKPIVSSRLSFTERT